MHVFIAFTAFWPAGGASSAVKQWIILRSSWFSWFKVLKSLISRIIYEINQIYKGNIAASANLSNMKMMIFFIYNKQLKMNLTDSIPLFNIFVDIAIILLLLILLATIII